MEGRADKNKIKCIIYSAAAVCWMVLIFIFSSQTGDESGQQSQFIMDIIRKIIPFELSETQTDTLHFLIRKAAHFTEYAVLGFLVYGALVNMIRAKKKFIFAIASAVCMLYAVSDEFHQSFTDGRGPSARDVVIDTCGGAVGAGIGAMLSCRRNKNKIINRTDIKENWES